MLSINTNITSLFSMTSLNKNTGAMNTALNRLSTGYRINSSKDDAAGSAISVSLEKEISSLDVAQDNAQMGQSMIDVATNTLNSMQTMVQRIRDLAEESANGTYGKDERKAMQNEVKALVAELYRIKNTTEFNGKKLFATEEPPEIKEIDELTESEAIDQGYKVVKTAKDLQTALVSDNPDCKVMLFSDIDLNDLGLDETGSNWTAVENFTGTFDGNGFTIYNLTSNKDDLYQGLFAKIKRATIKNVNLENVNITGKNYTGGIAGNSDTQSTIENCNVSGTISGGGMIGGIIGRAGSTTIKNCDVSASIKGRSLYVGGITGQNANGQIENCNVTGSVNGISYTGGISGLINQGKIYDCNISASVTGATCTGGIVGKTQGSMAVVSGSKTTGEVTGTSNSGAVIGQRSAGTITDNEYNSAINGDMKPVGSGLNPTKEQIRDNPSLLPPETEEYDTTVRLQVGTGSDSRSTIAVDTNFDIGKFDISVNSEAKASNSLKKIDALMEKVITKQTELGAVTNRLQSTMEFQEVQQSSKIQMLSVVKDADLAKESSNFIKSQILQQTTASLLAQANQTPSIALRLLAI